MKDQRLPPFVWQSRDAMAMVRHAFAKKERTVAISVYQSMTQLANDERGHEFTATRKEIAELAGVTDRTVDRYAAAFERVGLLTVERKTGRAGDQPSRYVLLNGPGGGEAASHPRERSPFAPPGEAASPPVDGSRRTDKEEEAATAAAAADGEQHLPGMAPPPDPAAGTRDAKIRRVWSHYATVFEHRIRVRELTKPRERTIGKALTAVADDDDLLCRAIDGLKFYRDQHPAGSQDVALSVIFETGPHSKSNLTDQITWWADQAPAVPGSIARMPIDLSGVPSVLAGTIRNRRGYVQSLERDRRTYGDDGVEPFVRRRGEEAVEWLRQTCGHEPVVADDGTVTWREVTGCG